MPETEAEESCEKTSMTNSQAKTIQIFLPTREPRSIRIAEFTIRTVRAVLIPRSELAEAKAKSELDQIAVYFLFGDTEESANPIVYIGQTEDVRKGSYGQLRLWSHRRRLQGNGGGVGEMASPCWRFKSWT